MIVVTGATGQLGRLVIKHLLRSEKPEAIVAAVRNPERAADLAALGVTVRHADYDKPDTLKSALKGADKVLLISSSEIGQRAKQHQNVIDAAKAQGVSLLAYTSILNADTSPLDLAQEHIETESALAVSGLPHVLLRNGWYSENYLMGVPSALMHGALIGSAGDGKISSAAREDYAEAAAKVLLSTSPQAGHCYELAGDESYTLTELSATLSALAGKTIPYLDLPEPAYKQALLEGGLPEPVAALLANSDAGAARGGLFDDGHTLSGLLGRATTPVYVLLKQILA